MKSYLPAFVLTLTAALSGACKNQTEDSKAQCMANAAYTWFEGRCVAKSSTAGQQAECQSKGNAYVWLNNTCMAKEVAQGPQAACEALGDGSQWYASPQTGEGRCYGPKQNVTAMAECEKQAGHTWDSKHLQCLGPEGQACNAANNIWIDGQCLSQDLYAQREACLARADGSEWFDKRCLSVAERQCAERGYHFRWSANERSCLAKTFADYCADPQAPADIQHSVKALQGLVKGLDSAAAASCVSAGERLKSLGTIELKQARLTNLMPLQGLTNLKELVLQDNEIVALGVMTSLPNLQRLNLTNNRVQDVSALKDLRFLQELNLGGNLLADLSPLVHLPALKSLYLNNNKITSVAPLAAVSENLAGGLAQLSVLSLDDNCGLKDIKILQRFTQLTFLSLERTGIAPANKPEFPPSTKVHHSQCPGT